MATPKKEDVDKKRENLFEKKKGWDARGPKNEMQKENAEASATKRGRETKTGLTEKEKKKTTEKEYEEGGKEMY